MTPRFPPPVRAGDRVGIAALSGPVDPDRLEAGIDGLADLGFDPVPAANLLARHDLYAGTDEQRLAGLDDLLADETIGAIFFARGGHGALRLLPRLDLERIGRRPRAWIGYSDLTPLLDLLVTRLGWIAFHGPMVAVEIAGGLDASERDALLGALAGEIPAAIRTAGALDDGAEREPSATGILRGGCLSMLCAVLGTPWATPFDGSILALEDVGEPTYRLDRMLTHLHLSGSLAGARGGVLGGLRGVDEPPDGRTPLPARVGAVLPGRPVLYGSDFGHGRPQLTLPLGVVARIDVRRPSLTLEQPRGDR